MSKKFEHSKKFYSVNEGARVNVGRYTNCLVMHHTTESKGGSWARGFRFYHSKWGCLKWTPKKRGSYQPPSKYSFDGGKTWHPVDAYGAANPFRATRKGKIRLETSSHGEFAFDGIQRINREWEGPGYQWRR